MCIGFPFDIFYSVLTYPGNQAQLLLMSGEMIKEMKLVSYADVGTCSKYSQAHEPSQSPN